MQGARRNRLVISGTALGLIVLLAAGLLGPLILGSDYDIPTAPQYPPAPLLDGHLPDGSQSFFLLGTDHLGRDVAVSAWPWGSGCR